MKRLIKDIIWAWRLKRAVRKAKKLSKLFGLKYYVIYMNGSIKVVPKKTICELVRSHRFRKGVTVADIEKLALFVTR